MGYSTAIEHLHAALNELAPDGIVQATVTRIRNDMERDHLPPKNVALTIASAIVDGLRSGNWPKEPR